MPIPIWPVQNKSRPNDTLLFNQVCPDYDAFISYPEATETIDHMQVYDGEGNLVNMQIWSKELFRLINRHYRHYEIAYNNPSDFLNRMWEIIEMEFPNYMIKKSRYDKLMSMNSKEIMKLGVRITNFIENTNDRADDVFEPLDNITSQNSELQTGDYVARLKGQLNVMQARLIQDFVSKFRTLFLRLTNKSVYFG